jgi:hypothetical protein
MRPQPVPATGPLKLSDHRRYPDSRIYLTCALYGWTKGYSPERAIDRLRALRGGGAAVGVVARPAAWPCPRVRAGEVALRPGLAAWDGRVGDQAPRQPLPELTDDDVPDPAPDDGHKRSR